MRAVRCHPLLVFVDVGHKFVINSYDILHSLTGAEGTSHENALEGAIM
jgi:hypothetical protein